MTDVFDLISKEALRQDNTVELIASENFVSDDIKRAVGSCLTNKYAEGYPDKRYYGGCGVVDEIEKLCQEGWKKVFHTNYHVNVQPHSGTNANIAAYLAVLNSEDTVLSMKLEDGGHLSHGLPVNISGKLFNFVHYGLDYAERIDWVSFRKLLWEHKPKLVVIGASAYSQRIDYCIPWDIVKQYEYETGERCYVLVDMAHVAGLIAAGQHPSPFGFADIITTTTHKTLRGPRGGLIFCTPELQKKVDSAVFPGIQGGPLLHVIAGKAICAQECQQKEFITYIENVKRNAWYMAEHFNQLGYRIVSGGTDNHLFVIDLRNNFPDISGKEAQEWLDAHNITVNKNTVPDETRSPFQTSGIRIGTPAMTTRGYSKDDFILVADRIDKLLKELQEEKHGAKES